MDVLSACPLRVGSLWWRPRPDAFGLTVACKATYVLEQGTSPFAGAQDELNPIDVYAGPVESSSLAAIGDLAPFKRRADVILVGHAYAPGGQPVRSLRARLSVGEIDKAIEIYGDRFFTLDEQLLDPVRFVKASLRWERASGGPGTNNPVGMRLDGPSDRRGSVAVPNLQPTSVHLASRRDVIPPIGFGPIAPTWPGRIDKLYRHADTWSHARWNEAPFPADVDAGYFNAAPPDQQIAELRSDERIALENLHPTHARLVTNLQAITPRAFVEAGGPAQEVRLRCDTLWIDTDRGTASLVWRGHVPLHHPAQPGRVVFTIDGWRPQPKSEGRVSTGSLNVAEIHRRVLPFGAGAPADRAPEAPRDHASGERPRAHSVYDPGTGDVDSMLANAPSALPFGSPATPPVVAKFASTGEIDTSIARRADALPFVRTPSAPPPAAPPPATPPPISPAAVAPPPRALFVLGGSLSTLAPPPAAAPQLPHSDPPPFVPMPQVAMPMPPQAAPEPMPEPPRDPVYPAQPPMIGPLAGAIVEPKNEPPSPAPAPTPPPAPVEPAPAEPAPTATSGLPLAAYPLKRCAAIAASLARRKTEKAKILEDVELTAEVWEALDDHWADAIQQDQERGKATLLSEYDAAYVAQLEAERGPITVKEYAQLVVAADRGNDQQTLADLGLPRGARLRVQRVWLKNIAETPALAKRVREAIERASEE